MSTDNLRERLAAAAATAKGRVKPPRINVADKLKAKPEPNPLANVEYTEDLEQDSAAEVNALQQGFRDRAKNEDDRFRLATDSEFWTVLCFRTRADKERFLLRAGLLEDLGDKYLDGYAVAAILGIDMSEEG